MPANRFVLFSQEDRQRRSINDGSEREARDGRPTPEMGGRRRRCRRLQGDADLEMEAMVLEMQGDADLCFRAKRRV